MYLLRILKYNNEHREERRKETHCYETRVNGTFRDARIFAWYFRDRETASRHSIIVLFILSSWKKNRRAIKANAQSGSQRSESKMKSLRRGGRAVEKERSARNVRENDSSNFLPVASPRKSRQSITTHFSKCSAATDRELFYGAEFPLFVSKRRANCLSMCTKNYSCTLQIATF